jgi:DNA adenine methylase
LGIVQAKAKEGHKVFVSEYNAPSDFKCVWRQELTNNLNLKKAVEKLFTYAPPKFVKKRKDR